VAGMSRVSLSSVFRDAAAAVLLTGVGGGGLGCDCNADATRPGDAMVASPRTSEQLNEPPVARTRVESLRWLAIGGGTVPDTNQVSLEQNIVLAESVLGTNGRVLFAGGSGRFGVQVLVGTPAQDPLLLELGELFDPRPDRQAQYRLTTLAVDGPSTASEVRQMFERVGSADGPPILVYVTTHGEQGEAPSDNAIALWRGGLLTVSELVAAMGETPSRQIQFVITSCFSGGFAELVFAHASSKEGATHVDRCGLFASTWNRESSGCDPNPDRRSQEGYGIHFWNALAGRDRNGRTLALAELDFNHDGRISLLEAHTRVRVASASIDIPTTTSERWIRHVAPSRGPMEAVDLPEERAVIEVLGTRLVLPDEGAARASLRDIEQRLADLDEQGVQVGERIDRLAAELQTDLLERWPALGDPWNVDFARTLDSHHLEIETSLRGSQIRPLFQQARAELDAMQSALDALEVRAAEVERLVRAYETVELGQRLRARGGPTWTVYERLLACERSIP